MEKEFYLMDIDYISEQDKPVIRLFGRTEHNKKVIALDRNFKPYFWIIPKKGKAKAWKH